MTWTVIRWVWQLKAPLFIGTHPAGALNRCRLYVPSRPMHGAVTSELARLNGDENSKFPDYGKFGREVGINCRFTYLFPAEKQDDKFLVWTPQFKMENGIQWYCHDGERCLPDRDFRRCLLDPRPGTAIDPESDSASEGTLRETECINPWWRASNSQGDPNPVLLLGYVFLRNNSFCRQLDSINTLFVGGDTRYGLGKICRVDWREVYGDLSVFGKQVHLDEKHFKIESDIVWGHALENGQFQFQDQMQGMQELLGGWDRGNPWQRKLAWIPGSFSEQSKTWSIDEYGYWVHRSGPSR
ncbi:MAG: hypothetical protein GXY53_11550 [Desulfobulbus sp.]|nr:hypothetical protein [Desulfobulbus sp.]